MDKYFIPLEEGKFYHIYNQGNNHEKYSTTTKITFISCRNSICICLILWNYMLFA